MKLLQALYIYENNTVSLFFDKIDQEWIDFMISKYDEWEPNIDLGYETPIKSNYTFLGTKYECISLWYDNEIDFWTHSTNQFNKNIWKDIKEML